MQDRTRHKSRAPIPKQGRLEPAPLLITICSVRKAVFQALGSLKTQSMPPWLMSLTFLATSPPHSGTAPPQPETTETYCSPSISQVTGEPMTPEPVLNFQSSVP